MGIEAAEQRYERAVQALEAARAVEKKALREFHDARHALISARAVRYELSMVKRSAADEPVPCPHCGELVRDASDVMPGYWEHLKPNGCYTRQYLKGLAEDRERRLATPETGPPSRLPKTGRT